MSFFITGEPESPGRLDEAIDQYQSALRLNPRFPEALNNLGVALGRSGRIPEAVAALEEAVRLQPDYADAQANLQLARERAGEASGRWSALSPTR